MLHYTWRARPLFPAPQLTNDSCLTAHGVPAPVAQPRNSRAVPAKLYTGCPPPLPRPAPHARRRFDYTLRGGPYSQPRKSCMVNAKLRMVRAPLPPRPATHAWLMLNHTCCARPCPCPKSCT
eukprot:263492-Pyramimonas_sp.AAC.1